MKNILIVLMLLFVGFVSCDGRKSKSVALRESIEEFKDSIGPIEIIKYIPEDYAEIVTDTLLSNGFRIKIKTYSDMEHGIVDSISVIDSITTKTIKRDFISDVTVFKDGKEIFSKKIDKPLFSATYDYHGDILKDMTLANVWVNQFMLSNQDVAQIEIDYYRKPNVYKDYPEEYYLHYGLIVDTDGTFAIKHIEY
ncbi:MAG: hypothetical protein R2783_08565 [Gelidibacter sp.]